MVVKTTYHVGAVVKGRRGLVLGKIGDPMTTEPAYLVFVDNAGVAIGIGIGIGRFQETFEVAHEEELHRVLLMVVVEFQFVFVGVIGIGVHHLLRFMLHAVGNAVVKNSL